MPNDDNFDLTLDEYLAEDGQPEGYFDPTTQFVINNDDDTPGILIAPRLWPDVARSTAEAKGGVRAHRVTGQDPALDLRKWPCGHGRLRA